jgi:quinohemoprotein ethanol dehydrogenase
MFRKWDSGGWRWIGLVLALALATTSLCSCGGGGQTGDGAEATTGIASAPRFGPEKLKAQAGSDWITNGGSLTNDRFSTLDQIDAENVTKLRGDWMTKIGKGASGPKYSAESQALEYHGTIYVSDGADDVFALDAGTGRVIWSYEPDLAPRAISAITCCGWENRGVALGQGLVFLSQLDGRQVALDQKTGRVVWWTRVARAGERLTITSAPLYYDGRVYVGGVGVSGERGRLTALDAKTGEIEWRSFTIPGPGEPGHGSWPHDNDAWRFGGAGIVNTPSVDPRLNTLYLSTSSAEPLWNGAVRAGDNRWSSSIVAMNAETGQIKWGYQQVHHDLWDLDSVSPTVLMDGEMDGRKVEAVAEPSKTVWAYVLDRTTGEPIYPVPEKDVSKDSEQAASPTQPMPTMEPFSPIVTIGAVIEARETVAARKPTPEVVGSEIFSPMSTDPDRIQLTPNSAIGGDNWPPSSFDPVNDLYLVTSTEGAVGVIAEPDPRPSQTAKPSEGGGIAVSSGVDAPGNLTAYDMSTGKIDWQDHFPESPYSGAVSTAGDIVFVGQSNGELQAFDTVTGVKLWGFQTGAGANTTPTVFEDEGEEKVGIYAGGNSLAKSRHGGNFWVFSLKGAMDQLKADQ